MLKKIITFVLNFALVILILALIVITLAINTILNEQYILKVLEANNFYERAYNDIKDGFENYTMQSGLELSILDDLISTYKVESDIKKVLSRVYTGKESIVETNSIKLELYYRIYTILEENKKVPDEAEEASIIAYIKSIGKVYENGIIYAKMNISPTILDVLKRNVIIGIVILELIIIIVNRNMNKILNALGVSLFASGVLSASVKILLEKRVQNILIMDQKFSNCLNYGINDCLLSFWNTGITLVIAGGVVILFSNIIFSYFSKKTIVDKNK